MENAEILYDVIGTRIFPISRLGEDFKAVVRGVDIPSAEKRAARLISILNMRSSKANNNIMVSRWWYVRKVSLVNVL